MLPFFRKQYNIVRYVPRSIAVMSEGKWPGAQTMKHAEHSQARANGVSRLHRDEAGYPAGGVGRDQFCNLGSFSCLMSASGAESFVIYWLLKGWQLERHIASNCLSAWDLLYFILTHNYVIRLLSPCFGIRHLEARGIPAWNWVVTTPCMVAEEREEKLATKLDWIT